MAPIEKSKLGSSQVMKLLLRLTLYYAIIFGILVIILNAFPGLMQFMPLGGGAEFSNQETTNTFAQSIIFSNLSSNYIENGLKLLFAIIGVILVMLPVTWVYLRIRASLDQSLVETMLILPVVVAGVVIIVQNSLALAFSLAGIVAAVRFRNTLKNTGDSLFIFASIGAGLAAGVRVLEIAIVVTIVFNYIFLLLWDLNYGAENAVKFMRSPDSDEWETAEKVTQRKKKKRSFHQDPDSQEWTPD
jgi:hypothetical protein